MIQGRNPTLIDSRWINKTCCPPCKILYVMYHFKLPQYCERSLSVEICLKNLENKRKGVLFLEISLLLHSRPAIKVAGFLSLFCFLFFLVRTLAIMIMIAAWIWKEVGEQGSIEVKREKLEIFRGPCKMEENAG